MESGKWRMESGEWQIAKQTEPPDVECSTNSACLAVELFSCLAVELSSCATKGRHGKELPLAHAQSKGWGVCVCVCVVVREEGCLLGCVFRLWTFGVTTNFNFPSKSYVNFCSGQCNQSSIRLGLSSGRTWTWTWTWTWLGGTATNRTFAGQSDDGDGAGDELKKEFQVNPMRNYKLCRANPKWALRKLLAN